MKENLEPNPSRQNLEMIGSVTSSPFVHSCLILFFFPFFASTSPYMAYLIAVLALKSN